MTDQVFDLFARFGLASVFITILLGAIGVPLPSTLLLLTIGALAAQGDIDVALISAVALLGAVLGDQIGYGIGRKTGRHSKFHSDSQSNFAKKITLARTYIKRWGIAAIFFSRWLVSPIGPWINLTCGMAGVSWRSFTLWAVAGEVVWVLLFLGLGYGFSRSVSELASIASNASWLLVGVAITFALGWKLYKIAGKNLKTSQRLS